MATYVSEHVAIDSRAEIDVDVEIGPFCVIGPHARIGKGTRLENNVTIMGHVTIGQHNHIYPGVVIGGEPQDVSYRGSDTQVVIGDSNSIREGVTINRATEKEDGITSVGSHNFFMACSHVAHDCRVGNHIIIANGTLLGGHVHVHDHASISGASLCHDRIVQLRGGHEPGVARRSSVHAGGRPPHAAAVHQRGGIETKQLFARGHR
jgi:UDP-N-acetylglucosamine acyltransferase